MADSTQPGEQSPEEIRKQKARESNRRYRAKHPNKDREYYVKNRERILAQCREYRQRNLAAKREANRQYYVKNKEKITAWRKSPAGRAVQKRASDKAAADPEKRQRRREMDRIYSRNYRRRHPERLKEITKRCYRKNRMARKEAARQRREKDPAKTRVLDAQRARESRKRFVAKYGVCQTTERARKDHVFRLIKNVRCRIYMALRQSNAAKNNRTMRLVGCTVSELVRHLESQFTEGMSWSNMGEWHIDHIVPCAAFDLTDPTQQHAAFHFTNMQPLWARDNMTKSAKVKGQSLFGFAYADKIAGAALEKPKRRRKHGRQHGDD